MEATTTITIAFNGIWDRGNVYSNYSTTCLDIGDGCTIAELFSSVAIRLELSDSSKLDTLSAYKRGADKCKRLAITEDRDVHWMVNGFASMGYTGCCLLTEITTAITDLYSMDTSRGPSVIRVGSMLPNNYELKEVLCKLALSRSFQYKTMKSSPKQFTRCCIHEACSWYVCASVYRGSSLWLFKKFIDSHTCLVDVVQDEHMQATPTIVSGYAESVIRSNEKGLCTPADVIKYAKDNHRVVVNYYKAMKGKEKALECMMGSPEDSYAFLSNFAAKLIEKNQGSYTTHDVDGDIRFKYFFMSTAASIEGWDHCLPVISVDGASLKNKFAGTLITACTFDGNGRIYPLAFEVVDSKNDASWGWFLRNLKAVYGKHEDLVVVSDSH